MTKVIDGVLSLLVIGSLSANGLLLSRARHPTPAVANHSAARATPARAVAPRRRVAVPKLVWGPPGSPADCAARSADLEAKAAELDHLGDRYLGPDVRFAHAGVNAKLTAELRTQLRGHRATDGRTPSPAALECRATVCRLAGLAADDEDEWLPGFMESGWATDHLQQATRDGDQIFFEARGRGGPTAPELVADELKAFERSDALASCRSRFARAGTLDVRVDVVAEEGDIDEEPPGIALHTGGALADTDLGQCIAAALERRLTGLTLPEGPDSATLSAQFPRPVLGTLAERRE